MSGQTIIWAVVPAAGCGRRMGTAQKKQYLQLGGKEILCYTLEALESYEPLDGIVLVTAEEDIPAVEALAASCLRRKAWKVVKGGETRQVSVKNGLEAVPEACEIVMIHDGVRPFVTLPVIEDSVRVAGQYGTAVAAIPARDTVKQVENPADTPEEPLRVASTPCRERLYCAQTPQTFRYELILEAHRKAAKAGDNECTDDGQIMEKYSDVTVRLSKGAAENIKITTPFDLAIAEVIINERKTV